MKKKLLFFTLIFLHSLSIWGMEAPPGKRRADEISSDSEQEDIDLTQQLLDTLESTWEPEDEQIVVDEVESLLEEGADPNARNYANIPALILATKTGNPIFVSLLLEYGADIATQTDRGETALYFSVAQRKRLGGTTDITRMLLAAGANPNIRNNNGETPFLFAIRLSNAPAVDLLLKAGADPNMKDGLSGETPLDYAVTFKDLAIVQKLLEAGADPNIPDNNGNTPLLFIVKFPNREIARMLLQAGANPYLTNNNGESAWSALERLINETQGEYFLQVREWIVHPETLPKRGFEKLP